MNRNQYENTRDYKKALKILKGFVDEELDGDIDAMRTLCFNDLTIESWNRRIYGAIIMPL